MYFSRCGFPFKTRKIRGLTYELAIRTKRLGFSPTKKIAGKAWLTGFLYRHPELMRKNTKNLSIARAKGANPTQIGYWFQMFKKAMNKLNLWYTPNRIWNIDECGVGDVPREGEAVVGVKGEQCSQTVSGEKSSNSTVLTFVSAGGLAVPPMVIFKGQRVATEWREAAPSGYTIKASENGYINQKHFSDYGEVFIRYLKERGLNRQTCILLLDQHSSHLFNLHFMEYMKAHNVEVYAFPPHTTHLLQPLDDTIFANFKNAYNARLLEMNFAKAGTKMNKYDFFKVFVPAFTSSMSYQSITKGFSNTGIYPYNPRTKKLKQVIPSHIFDKCKWPLPLCCCYVLSFFSCFFPGFFVGIAYGYRKGVRQKL